MPTAARNSGVHEDGRGEVGCGVVEPSSLGRVAVVAPAAARRLARRDAPLRSRVAPVLSQEAGEGAVVEGAAGDACADPSAPAPAARPARILAAGPSICPLAWTGGRAGGRRPARAVRPWRGCQPRACSGESATLARSAEPKNESEGVSSLTSTFIPPALCRAEQARRWVADTRPSPPPLPLTAQLPPQKRAPPPPSTLPLPSRALCLASCLPNATTPRTRPSSTTVIAAMFRPATTMTMRMMRSG